MRIDAVPVPEWVDVEWCSASVAVWCNRCRRGCGLYHTVLLEHPAEYAKAINKHRRCEGGEGEHGNPTLR